MKILTADDDESARTILTRTLRSLGHEVIETKDGLEAWGQFRLYGFPLVISDWMMPGMNGIEFTKLVRKENRPKYTYVIMLTSLEGKGRYLEGMEAGADDFLNKPFDKETLVARLRVAERILSLQAEVKLLEGLLPICAYCKRIKDEGDHWQNMETYISHRTDANFSHGICPNCYEKHMIPQLHELRKLKKAQ